MIIQWIRLKEISEKILFEAISQRLAVSLHGSTDIDGGLRAAVDRSGSSVNIVLNLLYNKSLPDVFASIAHELAHVTLGTSDHPFAHDIETRRVSDRLREEYEKGGDLPASEAERRPPAGVDGDRGSTRPGGPNPEVSGSRPRRSIPKKKGRR